jgi:hypothetical protein
MKKLEFERMSWARRLLPGSGFILAASLLFLPLQGWAIEATGVFVEYLDKLTTGRVGSPLKLKRGEAAATNVSFKPPVEILIEAKTHTTNLRIGYAARQVIFNWEHIGDELRVDGGPANGKHKGGAGAIPRDKYVVIRWVVTPKRQSIYVDDQLRYDHAGDYSQIDNPVSVFGAEGSEVTVKSIKVKLLPADSQ